MSAPLASLSILTSFNVLDSTSPCPCGSGLRYVRCCGLDWTAVAEPEPAPELGPARAALAAGDRTKAERQLVELLERSPKHVGALALLHELCAARRPARRRRRCWRGSCGSIRTISPRRRRSRCRCSTRARWPRPSVHARNAVRIAPTDAQSHNLMGMIMTEAHRPQVGEHHYRRAMELIASPSPILVANLAWNLKNQGRMAESRELYQESVAARPDDLPDPLRLGADGGDRPQFRAGRRAARRGGETVARKPERAPATRDPARARQGLRQGAGRARRDRKAARGRRPRAGRMEREGASARPDGPICRGLRRLHRGQTVAARADRPELSGGGGRGAGAASDWLFRRRRGSKSCRAPASAPKSPSRSSSSAFPAPARP